MFAFHAQLWALETGPHLPCPPVLLKAWAHALEEWQELTKHLMSDQVSGLYKISSVQMIPSGIGPQVHDPSFSAGLCEGGNALDNLDLTST